MSNLKKNYIKLGLIIIASILLTIVIFNIYNNYEEKKNNQSYISSYVQNLKYNELNVALPEINDDAFIYLTYTGNFKIYDLEVNVKKILKKNKLMEKFIYIDCTDIIDENNKINTLNEYLQVSTNKEIVLPAIIYYKDNKAVDFIDSTNRVIDAPLFSQLIDKYEVGE